MEPVVTYRFRAELWEYQGQNSWFFISLPFDESDEIDELTRSTQRGFGSVRVSATIGRTSWNTSIFPDAKAKTYVLPIKKAVRTAEKIGVGNTFNVELTLVDVGRTN